nr:chloroplast translation initiation factor 1 [Hypericum ascyron]
MPSTLLQTLVPSFGWFSPPAPPPPPRPLSLSLPASKRSPPLARRAAPARAKQSPGEEKFTNEGSVLESLPNGVFRVKLDNNEVIMANASGRIRQNFVRILPGDRVKVEIGRYDTSRGRIIFRHRAGAKNPDAD